MLIGEIRSSSTMKIIRHILQVLMVVCVLDNASGFYWELWSFNNMCNEESALTFSRRNPWDCTRYMICMAGVALPGSCAPGMIYSSNVQGCRQPRPSELQRCGRSILESLEGACLQRPGWKFKSPFSCAQFFECARPHQLTSANSPSSSATSGGGTLNPRKLHQSENPLQLIECPYPSYYSTATGKCQSFDNVACGVRPQPKAPCEYIQYQQLCESPKCIPCPQRHPSCVGLPNGAHALQGYDNLYILCYAERTFDVRKCNTGYIFSMVQKTCVQKL